jgi:hypothetical protein
MADLAVKIDRSQLGCGFDGQIVLRTALDNLSAHGAGGMIDGSLRIGAQ